MQTVLSFLIDNRETKRKRKASKIGMIWSIIHSEPYEPKITNVSELTDDLGKAVLEINKPMLLRGEATEIHSVFLNAVTVLLAHASVYSNFEKMVDSSVATNRTMRDYLQPVTGDTHLPKHITKFQGYSVLHVNYNDRLNSLLVGLMSPSTTGLDKIRICEKVYWIMNNYYTFFTSYPLDTESHDFKEILEFETANEKPNEWITEKQIGSAGKVYYSLPKNGISMLRILREKYDVTNPEELLILLRTTRKH